jgi:Fe-S-cluster containining protein
MLAAKRSSLLTILDVVSKEITQALPKIGEPVQCSTGCAGCCYQVVVASLAEAEYVVESLCPNGTPEELLELKQQLVPLVARIDRPGITREGWFRRTIPCPALRNIDNTGEVWAGTCAAYANRPVACRTYFAVSAPTLCSPASPDTTVRSPDFRAVDTWAFLRLVDRVDGEVPKIAPLQVTMLHCVLLKLGEPGFTEQVWSTWLTRMNGWAVAGAGSTDSAPPKKPAASRRARAK